MTALIPNTARFRRIYPSRLGARIQHSTPKSDGWERGLDRNPVAVYLELLDQLGLTDPTDAHILHSRARELYSAARQPASPPPTIETNARALAAGSLTIAELDKQLARATDREAARRSHRLRKDTLDSAARRAYTLALKALTDHGDTFITDDLRPLVDQTLDDPHAGASQIRWTVAHELVAHLRGIGAIPTITGANALECCVERPDLVYVWHLDEQVDAIDEAIVHTANGTHYTAWTGRVPVPPLPMLASRRAAWRPGIFTASEILEYSHVWDEDADIRRAAFPRPDAAERVIGRHAAQAGRAS